MASNFVADIPGNGGQIIIELVASTIGRANDRSRDSLAVKREMSERDNLIVTAMVKEDAGDRGQPPGNVTWQLEIVEIPIMLIP